MPSHASIHERKPATRPESMQRARRNGAVRPGQLLAAVAIGLSTLGTMGAVAATMKDASTANQSIASGTLTLTTAASPGVGVAAAVTGLAPGSRANRFVVLTNGGTVAAQALTLTVTGTVSTLTGALQVTVDSCSIPWNGSFACTGTTTSIRTATPLNTLLGGSTTTIAASVAPGGTVNLRIGVSIASTAIITTDGVATYQGTTSNITWTFTQQQVAGATANS